MYRNCGAIREDTGAYNTRGATVDQMLAEGGVCS